MFEVYTNYEAARFGRTENYNISNLLSCICLVCLSRCVISFAYVRTMSSLYCTQRKRFVLFLSHTVFKSYVYVHSSGIIYTARAVLALLLCDGVVTRAKKDWWNANEMLRTVRLCSVQYANLDGLNLKPTTRDVDVTGKFFRKFTLNLRKIYHDRWPTLDCFTYLKTLDHTFYSVNIAAVKAYLTKGR